MRLAPGQKVEPRAIITLRPKYGMQMILEQRRTAFVEQPAARESKRPA
jgi:hypothetical protein